MAPFLRTLDAQLAEVTSTLTMAYGGHIDIVVLADHGMSAVKRTVDVRPILAGVGLVPGSDYLYFLDSTTVRFWSHSEHTLAKLRHAFERAVGMRVLDPHDRAALDIPHDGSTGDLLIALDEESVVFPDFFRLTGAPLGMHGYAHVATEAGMPYLAADAGIAKGLEIEAGRLIGHAEVWGAMRSALGISSSSHQAAFETHRVVA
jgi:hypothetical protein